MTLRLQRRRFRFALLQPLRTAAGELRERCGWLLRLDDDQVPPDRLPTVCRQLGERISSRSRYWS